MSVGLALLVSADEGAIQHVREALEELSIPLDVCGDVPTAIRLLNRRKFDAVIADQNLGDHAGWVLDEVHISASNRTAVTFAIAGTDVESTTTFQKGASFVFERPLSTESIRRTLRPAYGLILREQRRYFRCPIAVSVVIQKPPKWEVHCESVNISEGGMALSTSVALKAGEQVQVQFTLPGHKVPCITGATVCWSKTERLGLRFLSPSRDWNSELQEWLSRKLEELLPGSVAESFQKTDDSSAPTSKKNT